MDNSPLVLVTGATGHIGYAVLLGLLKAGYSARVAIRRQGQRDALLSSPAIQALGSAASRISFALVPDITAPEAYDGALAGITHIIHIACPLPRVSVTDVEREVIQPAVRGTANLLISVSRHPAVKRVVITSSVAAIADIFHPGRYVEALTADCRQPNYTADFVKDADTAYAAAKTAALNATDEFIRTMRPTFDVINIIPAYVFGPKGLARTVKDILNGSNLIGLGMAVTEYPWDDNIVSASSCHVDDVAMAHIRALDANVKGNQSFVLASQFNPADAMGILEKRFPDAVTNGIFSRKGCYRWHHIPIDVTRTEEQLLGRKLKGFDEQVVDTAGQILSILTVGKD